MILNATTTVTFSSISCTLSHHEWSRRMFRFGLCVSSRQGGPHLILIYCDSYLGFCLNVEEIANGVRGCQA
jgi:hypothetical protein